MMTTSMLLISCCMSRRTETCLLSPMETLIITDSEPVNYLSNPVPGYLRQPHLVDDK